MIEEVADCVEKLSVVARKRRAATRKPPRRDGTIVRVV